MYSGALPATVDQGVVLAEVYSYVLDGTYPAIVLTPRCDIAQTNADYLTFIPLRPAEAVVQELLESGWVKLLTPEGTLPGALTPVQRGNLTSELKKMARQAIPRYHWLECWDDSGVERIADFQTVESATLEELEFLQRVAALEGPYREQLAARYASYMGRVGTPDTEPTQLTASVESVIAKIFGLGATPAPAPPTGPQGH